MTDKRNPLISYWSVPAGNDQPKDLALRGAVLNNYIEIPVKINLKIPLCEIYTIIAWSTSLYNDLPLV
jgi:hypothetical protein